MDGWGWYDNAPDMLPGRKVVAYGKLENALFQAESMEAQRVYLASLNSYFYARPNSANSTANEEETGLLPTGHLRWN